ncbi:MAG TPA: glycerol-3-phosphate dehydrogenase/oxidase [Ktedonobacterales bacterium]
MTTIGDTAGNLSPASRAAALASMARDTLDVLIIGGGITGAGIALDATLRGYRVGLVERDDFASGTSSRSTKLVHGGIRYLPQLDIGLVAEGLHERGRLLANAPHLAHPLAFLLPLYEDSRHPVGIPFTTPGGVGLGPILDVGLLTYDMLAGGMSLGQHRRLGREGIAARMPGLTHDGLKDGFLYYDGQTDDSRLTVAVLRSAAERGALLASYAEVTRFEMSDAQVAGAWVRESLDGASGPERLILARHVVNATGVWAEEVDELSGGSKLSVVPSKGVHIVVSRETFAIGDEAVVLPETDDGRIIFVVPWLSRVIIGTTDDEVTSPDEPVASGDDIDYLLRHVNRHAVRTLTRSDIIATWAGNRPLLRLRKGKSTGKLSRAHEVVEQANGLITISGGKLTSYRAMAQDVVDHIDRHEDRKADCQTADFRLWGGVGWPEALGEVYARGQRAGLDVGILEHLGQAHGTDALRVLSLVEGDATLGRRLVPDLPYIAAEVIHAMRAEGALTLIDVLARRLHLALEDTAHGLDALATVSALVAGELGWSEGDRAAHEQRYAAWVIREQAALSRPTPDETHHATNGNPAP